MKIKIYALQKLIDILSGKRKTIFQAKIIQKKLQKSVEKLREKEKIKVAFLQMYPANCQTFSVFAKMLEDKRFEPYFITTLDIMRDKKHSLKVYNDNVQFLESKYGKERVLRGYDEKSDTFIDYSDDFDMMTTNNPYENFCDKYHTARFWASKNIPIFYISYFYMGREQITRLNLRSQFFIYVWRHFIENKIVLDIAKKSQKLLRGSNMVLTGYPKMDEYALIESKLKDSIESSRPLIIISPHHTIYDDNPNNVGSFLQFYETLLDLPQKYPQIDFVFRPHPVLFYVLRTEIWDEKRAQEYYDKMLSFNNVRFSNEANYLELFAKSSALIHDCGSFGAEYLYTGKPCAYMWRDDLESRNILTPFGRACIDAHYPLRKSQDFYDFIDNVILKGQDCMKESRTTFAKNEVMINYPHATDKVMESIKGSVG